MSTHFRHDTRTAPVLIGQSNQVAGLRRFAQKVGPLDHTVLILGENGTGKDRMAELIHFHGRPGRPFVMVNCMGRGENLLENDLFGHIAGAFTSATTTTAGKFEVAGNGTLCLNEIGELTPELQVKLLDVIENKSYCPLGSPQEFPLRARIVAATNKDMEEALKSGQVREDFYQRLDQLRCQVPPLRERRGDIPLLADHFLQRENASKRFSQGAMSALVNYHWPGNIRELNSVVLKAVLNVEDAMQIGEEHLVLRATSTEASPKSFGIGNGDNFPTLHQVQEAYLRDLLERTKGNLVKACGIAGVQRTTLCEQVKRFGLRDYANKIRES